MILFGDRVVCSTGDLVEAALCEFALLRALDAELGLVGPVEYRAPGVLPRPADPERENRLADLRDRHGSGVVRIRTEITHPAPTAHDHRMGFEGGGLAARMAELGLRDPAGTGAAGTGAGAGSADPALVVAALAVAHEATVAALRGDAEVIASPVLFEGDFAVGCDFLLRDSAPETHDYLTAGVANRRTRIGTLLEHAAFADALQRTGFRPAPHTRIWLGGQAGTHTLADIAVVYRARRGRLALILDAKLNELLPVQWGDRRFLACGQCVTCTAELEARRDLLLVAGMRPAVRAQLRDAGITTVDRLAASDGAVTGVPAPTFTALRRQAELQLHREHTGHPIYTVLDADALGGLPAPTAGDLFVSVTAPEAGTATDLLVTIGSGEPENIFRTFVIHDRSDEPRGPYPADDAAALLDFLAEWQWNHPGLRIHHYRGGLRPLLAGLADQHPDGEDIVAALLPLLLDLYPIVRSALLVGERSYGLHHLPPNLFGPNDFDEHPETAPGPPEPDHGPPVGNGHTAARHRAHAAVAVLDRTVLTEVGTTRVLTDASVADTAPADTAATDAAHTLAARADAAHTAAAHTDTAHTETTHVDTGLVETSRVDAVRGEAADMRAAGRADAVRTLGIGSARAEFVDADRARAHPVRAGAVAAPPAAHPEAEFVADAATVPDESVWVEAEFVDGGFAGGALTESLLPAAALTELEHAALAHLDSDCAAAADGAGDWVAVARLRDWLLELAEGHAVHPRGRPDEMVAEPVPAAVEAALREFAAGPVRDDAARSGGVAAYDAAADPAHPDRSAGGRRTDARLAAALTAAALGYHRRERRPLRWAHADRLDHPVEEWADTPGVLIADWGTVDTNWHSTGQHPMRRYLTLTGRLGTGQAPPPGTPVVTLYDRATPDIPARPGRRPLARATVLGCALDANFDDVVRVVELLPAGCEPFDELPAAIAPCPPAREDRLEDAIEDVANELLVTLPEVPPTATFDLLCRRPPRLLSGGTLPEVFGDHAAAVTAAVLDLADSYVAVQGPPGTGKTDTTARAVERLVTRYKWRVGVVARSHVAVEHLLDAVVRVGVLPELVAKADAQTVAPEWLGIDADRYVRFLDNAVNGCVVGGLPDDFADTARIPRDSLDLLVIADAGRFPLADAVAVAVSARNLLLVGDPAPRAGHGAHPEPVDEAVLGWLIGPHRTLPTEYGYFLDRTWRMHPRMCGPVSRLRYDNRLRTNETVTLARELDGVAPGIRTVTVEHHGNATESAEEAREIVRQVRTLLGLPWHTGAVTRRLHPHDILVVAPYHAQVARIRTSLSRARIEDVLVGTPDHFQGREAAVVLVSMTTSAPKDAPYGVAPLLSRHWLTSAISRAMWAAVIVRSPLLAEYLPTGTAELSDLAAFLQLDRV
ncbi:bifunctional RecB family nuclease/DEAD/DEAH box helicase [Nocardia sp. CC227C]|uniref:bifunctional RecB family nuclease/DEAD/DEAH box helicase n=1 Tax=Nocardia sp. CC227C TaxID=3044562 RepID=UPI00278C8858|nr:AAA domain-containing protein [Nocardia sp. CC227C]